MASKIAWNIGKMFSELKDATPVGDWLPFLEDNAPWIARATVARYISHFKKHRNPDQISDEGFLKQLPLFCGVPDEPAAEKDKKEPDTCNTYLGWIQKVRLALPISRLNELPPESRQRIKSGLEPLVKLYNAL